MKSATFLCDISCRQSRLRIDPVSMPKLSTGIALPVPIKEGACRREFWHDYERDNQLFFRNFYFSGPDYSIV